VDLDPPHLVQGSGVVQGTTVRFHEKDVDNNGKDIRVGGRETVRPRAFDFSLSRHPWSVPVRMTGAGTRRLPIHSDGKSN
jgi:hypothetical protein